MKILAMAIKKQPQNMVFLSNKNHLRHLRIEKRLPDSILWQCIVSLLIVLRGERFNLVALLCSNRGKKKTHD